ncbi:MAG TPA: MBL fold metallo-hydrolase [Gaiellaceae bacterium]
MQLTVIGSSPAWPNPGSAQSGYLLEGAASGKLLLDCGPGVLGRLRARGPLDVDAVAITHFHLDHWGDLVPWAWLSAYGDAGMRAELWLPPGGSEQLATFASFWGNDAMFDRAFELHEYERGVPFEAAGFTIEARQVPHYTLTAFGFRVSENGRLLAYSGDSAPGEQLADLARGADLFLCEATLKSPDRDGPPRGHLTAEEAHAASDGRLLLTHRPIELPLDGDDVACDGLVVDV